MAEGEKQAIRASFSGKRVSQMTDPEHQVFDEDFQYGVANRDSQNARKVKSSLKKKTDFPSILKRLGIRKQ